MKKNIAVIHTLIHAESEDNKVTPQCSLIIKINAN